LDLTATLDLDVECGLAMEVLVNADQALTVEAVRRALLAKHRGLRKTEVTDAVHRVFEATILVGRECIAARRRGAL
jgi:hypothetical protein